MLGRSEKDRENHGTRTLSHNDTRLTDRDEILARGAKSVFEGAQDEVVGQLDSDNCDSLRTSSRRQPFFRRREASSAHRYVVRLQIHYPVRTSSLQAPALWYTLQPEFDLSLQFPHSPFTDLTTQRFRPSRLAIMEQ